MLNPDFQLHPIQLKQRSLNAKFVLSVGGARASKTFGNCILIEDYALTCPGLRVGIFRQTATAARSTLFDLTYREASRTRDPDIMKTCKINESEMTIEYENGSKIMFFGLEEHNKERILGQEFGLIFVNEASEFPSFKSIAFLISRLNQQVKGPNGFIMPNRFLIDCNPPASSHWTYKLFIEKVQPETGQPLKDPHNYQHILMNPADNKSLSADYIETLASTYSAADRRRFIDGQFAMEAEGAMFKMEWIDAARVDSVDDIDFERIVVAVDPATTSNAGSDETGIAVVGEFEGEAYLLHDGSMKGSPKAWAAKVNELYDRYQADLVVYESNQGGEMVADVLRQHNPNLPVKAVHASRGKEIRAEPVAHLYEEGKVHHVGEFKKLEEQICLFTKGFNRRKNGSPDRLDALVWGITELMLKEKRKPQKAIQATAQGFW
ncbi:phage terminase large subunit [Brevundimonas olei]|uniref:phage terminase large subunit n=1 Tax=Brevundimonas olei TaxID=657642 RepID=UPI0031DF2B98